MLSLNNVTVAFRNGADHNPVVKGINLILARGQTLALVGESGSGKSVTALAILRLLAKNAVVGGQIDFDGQDLLAADEAALRQLRGNRIAMIFQEPMTALNPLHTIEKQIGEILFVHKKMHGPALRARVLDLLHKVGLPNPEQRLHAYPHELSGGQRQRVMIAMALANDPDILIADEPTTALDVTVQKQILNLLQDIQKQSGMAMLVITHDLNIVRRMAQRVAVMRQGVIVEQGETAALFAAPQHDYTKMLLASEPKTIAPAADDKAKFLLSGTDIKVHFPIKKGLLRRIVGYVRAVDGVSIAVRAGHTLGIVGESGSGKTTLGLALLRLLPSTGPIVFMGRDIAGLDQRAVRPLRRHLQIVFQDPFASLSPRLSVADIIAEGLWVHEPSLSAAECDARVCAVLRDVGMDAETRHRYPHEFSGGQRQRISIARALVLKPSVIVLDEPTSALDASVQAQVLALLLALQKQYDLTYIFISHDLRVIRAMAHDVVVMKAGHVVEMGPASQLFENPEQDYTRDLLHAALG